MHFAVGAETRIATCIHRVFGVAMPEVVRLPVMVKFGCCTDDLFVALCLVLVVQSLSKKRKRWKPSHRAVFSEIVVYCSNLASIRTAARGADWPRQGLQFPASPGSTARMPRNECASAHLAHRTGIKSFPSACGMYIYTYRFTYLNAFSMWLKKCV